MVFVHRRAAARGIGEDGVHIRGKGVEIPPRECLRRAQVAGVPGKSAAAALPAGTITSTPLRASTSIVAVLMSGSSTCCAQPASNATRARRSPRAGVTAGQLCAGGTAVRHEIEHRPQHAGHQRPKQFSEPSRHRRETKARRKRNRLRREEAPQLLAKRAFEVRLARSRGTG